MEILSVNARRVRRRLVDPDWRIDPSIDFTMLSIMFAAWLMERRKPAPPARLALPGRVKKNAQKKSPPAWGDVGGRR